jgi:hypothetical protein
LHSPRAHRWHHCAASSIASASPRAKAGRWHSERIFFFLGAHHAAALALNARFPFVHALYPSLQEWMKTSTIGAHSPPSPPMTINDINQSLRVQK